MSEDTYLDYKTEQQEKSPTTLIVLLVLSGLNIGYQLLNQLLSIGQDINEVQDGFAIMLEQFDNANMPSWVLEGMEDFVINMVENYSTVQLASLIVGLVGAASVVMMAMRMKAGFSVYVIYSILGLITVFLLGFNFISLSFLAIGTLFTLLFIWLYSKQRVLLHK